MIGRIEIRGRLNALLDASLGMNMELTGRENIMLRGLYNGLPRPALARLEDDVAEFAGLGDFLDLPVRIYSAGMVVRLGFALATAIRPEILLMDEWILAAMRNSSNGRGIGWRRWCAAPTSLCSRPMTRDHNDMVHPGDLAGPGTPAARRSARSGGRRLSGPRCRASGGRHRRLNCDQVIACASSVFSETGPEASSFATA